MNIDDLEIEYKERTRIAMAMGGEKKLARIREAGHLNARDRLEYLFDKGSFVEVGRFATSLRPEDWDTTPADGKIAGFGTVAGRQVGAVANDFTVKGASSSPINGAKIKHMKQTASRSGFPMVFLGESTGARMPDVMGASGVGQSKNPTQYQRRRESPWAGAVLGDSYGSATWYSVLSDFVVIRKGAVMALSSPKLIAMATGETVEPEELGGWMLHTRVTGFADAAVDTDEEAIDMIKRFLSYMPSHSGELPPKVEYVTTAEEESKRAETLRTLVPTARTQGYDMRRVLSYIADKGSVLELKSGYGRSVLTALARINGQVVGILASNPFFKGGAMDADACSKATGMLVLCDSFNIPIITLVDQPGFLVGIDVERRGMAGRVMNWMNALSLVTVPKISIIIRKTYGQALLNMGMGGNVDQQCAWTTADISFMDPNHGVSIVHNIKEQDDPERFAELREEMSKDTSAYAAARVLSVENVIDPRETRDYLTRMLEIHCAGGKCLSAGYLRDWPTTVV